MQADSVKDATAWVVALKSTTHQATSSLAAVPTLSEKAAILSIHDEGDNEGTDQTGSFLSRFEA
jgi:hypothetical protein